jgi:acyl-coenzyme A thioesterase PaaI-like protein
LPLPRGPRAPHLSIPIAKERALSTPTPLPGHGVCFVCGHENPCGLGLDWYRDGERVASDFTTAPTLQGPPGHVHGGASAAILDEAMGKIVWLSGLQVVLATMTLDYAKPTPLGVQVRAEAWIERIEGRKAYAASHLLLSDGSVAVRATGLYIDVPDFFHGRHAYAG